MDRVTFNEPSTTISQPIGCNELNIFSTEGTALNAPISVRDQLVLDTPRLSIGCNGNLILASGCRVYCKARKLQLRGGVPHKHLLKFREEVERSCFRTVRFVVRSGRRLGEGATVVDETPLKQAKLEEQARYEQEHPNGQEDQEQILQEQKHSESQSAALMVNNTAAALSDFPSGGITQQQGSSTSRDLLQQIKKDRQGLTNPALQAASATDNGDGAPSVSNRALSVTADSPSIPILPTLPMGDRAQQKTATIMSQDLLGQIRSYKQGLVDPLLLRPPKRAKIEETHQAPLKLPSPDATEEQALLNGAAPSKKNGHALASAAAGIPTPKIPIPPPVPPKGLAQQQTFPAGPRLLEEIRKLSAAITNKEKWALRKKRERLCQEIQDALDEICKKGKKERSIDSDRIANLTRHLQGEPYKRLGVCALDVDYAEHVKHKSAWEAASELLAKVVDLQLFGDLLVAVGALEKGFPIDKARVKVLEAIATRLFPYRRESQNYSDGVKSIEAMFKENVGANLRKLSPLFNNMDRNILLTGLVLEVMYYITKFEEAKVKLCEEDGERYEDIETKIRLGIRGSGLFEDESCSQGSFYGNASLFGSLYMEAGRLKEYRAEQLREKLKIFYQKLSDIEKPQADYEKAVNNYVHYSEGAGKSVPNAGTLKLTNERRAASLDLALREDIQVLSRLKGELENFDLNKDQKEYLEKMVAAFEGIQAKVALLRKEHDRLVEAEDSTPEGSLSSSPPEYSPIQSDRASHHDLSFEGDITGVLSHVDWTKFQNMSIDGDHSYRSTDGSWTIEE